MHHTGNVQTLADKIRDTMAASTVTMVSSSPLATLAAEWHGCQKVKTDVVPLGREPCFFGLQRIGFCWDAAAVRLPPALLFLGYVHRGSLGSTLWVP
jgi:hypothetical protein